VSIVNGYRCGGEGDGNGAPSRQWPGHRGRTPPPSLNPQEGTTKRTKMEKKGKYLDLLILHYARLVPHLSTFTAGRQRGN
jgi:hypothetical protein